MLTTLATTLAGHLRVASIAVAAALLGAGGAVATVATVSDSTPTADPGAVVSTLAADDDQGEDGEAAGRDRGRRDRHGHPGGREPSRPRQRRPSCWPRRPCPPVLYDPAACADAVNHGAYVSYVAHATKGTPDHGALVSAAAQSDCGKTDKAEKAVAKAAKSREGRRPPRRPPRRRRSRQGGREAAGPREEGRQPRQRPDQGPGK